MAEAETLFPSADRHQAELRAMAELERLPGVVTAAVWIGMDGRLRDARIHILPGAAPTIIANAASRVLEAVGLAVDPGTIRISTLPLPDDVHGAHLAPAGGRFLLLQDLSLTRTGAHVSCRVQLVRENQVSVGEARELDTAAGRARAAANATLRAAEDAAEGLALGLEAAAITSLFGRNYGVVSVEAAIGRRVATLSGIVPVDAGRAAEEAVCLATLRAIDRWIAI
ncbi:MAG TPA: hypothetical protein VMN60_01855 [Longimicrobiales bacterium]|nr:hypothetical protein [Longimicrobiales bacterium]